MSPADLYYICIVVKRLKTSENDWLPSVEAHKTEYRLTRDDPTFQKKMRKAEKIMARYDNTLRALTKKTSRG